MKNKLLFLVSLFVYLNASAQKDTLFWFAAPEISASPTFWNGLDRPIFLRISAYSSNSTVTISQPANPSFTPIVVNVPANGNVSVDMTPYIGSLENITPNVVLNYGLKITATQPIAIYYDEISSQNPELFPLKGQNALGTDFYIPSQNLLPNVNQYSPLGYFSFDIVATEDNTTVTITPSKNIVGHVAGVTYSVILNKGQTYSAKATSQAANQHLDGSRVISNKPIAITIKDDLLNASSVYQTAHDIGGAQIIPTNRLGTEYIAVKGQLVSPYDKIFVLATQNGTTISQNGVFVSTINAGATQMLNMTDTTANYIQANHPVYVLQLTGYGGEIGLDILPPINCTGSNQVAYTRALAGSLYFMLLVRNGGQGNFLFNGATGIINASSFFTVPGTGGQWYAAKVSISTSTLPQNATALITNTSNLFHLGVIASVQGQGAGFGYFSDFNSFYLQANNNAPCFGNTLQLSADSIQGAVYSWSGPNGFSSSSVNPVKPNFSVADTGIYTLTVSQNGCSSTSTTRVQQNNLSLAISTTNTSCGMNNGSVKVNVISGQAPFTYLWNNGSAADSLSSLAAGIYSVTVHDAGGCSSTAGALINSSGSGSVSITANKTVICSGDSAFLCAPANNIAYQWNTGETTQCIYAKFAGNYYVTVTDNGNCTASSNHLAISVYPLPAVSLSINGDTLTAYGAVNYQWYYNDVIIPGATSPVYIAQQTGNYSVVVTDGNGCKATSSKVSVIVSGIKDETNSELLNVYPNPNTYNSWQLSVSDNFLGSEVVIFDMDGRKVFKTTISDKHSVINFDSAKGIYLMRVSNGSQILYRKLGRL